MKIIFWGTPEYSVPSLHILKKSKHEIIAVISQPDKKRSRGNKLTPSAVKKYATSNNIPIYTPETIKGNSDFIKKLEEISCDLFVVIAYGKILPKQILNIPKYGSWNAHASLLPRWRGAAPIQWSLLEEDNFTGVGIMKMEEGLDTGDLLIEKKIKIEKEDNLNSLTDKLSNLSAKLIITAISKIEQNKNVKIHSYLTKQISLGRDIKYARMINKSDYKINWGDKAIDIVRKVKALYPRTYITFRGKNLKIIKIRIIRNDEIIKKKYNFLNILKTGFVIGVIEDLGIAISTKTEPIIILEAKLEGKNISSKTQLIQQLKPILGEKFSD